MAAGIRRSEIIERAESWLWPSVAHSTTKFHQNEFGIYRTDCSGYVSMAWGLPGIPDDRWGGLDTLELAGVSALIGKDDLRAGDILLDAGRVVIFHEWAAQDQSEYWGFEQSGETGTVRRQIPYPHDSDGDFTPRRYANLF
ncbi:MAG TPA: hypothetical protein VM677_23795 [Actinokineospora sp.]|nr:hypothetical protein [Actinokineospora sp.]